MRQTTREFSVVGAWPKGITVGNWREGGCTAHSFSSNVNNRWMDGNWVLD